MLKKMFSMILLIQLVFVFSIVGLAADYTISFGIGLDANSVQCKSAMFFKELVEQNSSGRIEVEVYPGGQIGSDIEMMEALQMGFQEMTWPATAPVSTFVEELQILDLPFAFPSLESADYVLDSSFGQSILDKFPEIGLIGLAWGEIGTRHLTNNVRPVKNIEDLKGLKIRTMQNTVHLATWRALGASPGPLSFGELFSSLQQGVFDGMEMPWDIVYDMKFYEVQKYGTDIAWVYSPAVMLMSKIFWDKLPAELQNVVKDAALRTQEHNRTLRRKTEQEKLTELKEKMEITFLTSEQKSEFIKAAQPVHEEVKEEIGVELYEGLMNKLVEFQAQNK